MAGTFTHWMIAAKVIEKLNSNPERHKYIDILLKKRPYAMLGAVGPDYPYMSEVIKDILQLKRHSWADRMHYENTGDFVRHGVQNLSAMGGGGGFEVCLAWLCGFVTHIIADTVVHPVVNSIVGPYLFNSEEHRHCEMIQDSFIYHDIKGEEISYEGFLPLLSACSTSYGGINPFIKRFWKETLISSHPKRRPEDNDFFDDIDPDDWHEDFLSKIAFAGDPILISRHLGQEKSIVYKKTDKITPAERNRFIENVKIPGGVTGHFKKDVFNKAVRHAAEVILLLFADIEKTLQGDGDGRLPYVKNWNLDLGVDEDSPDLWEG